MKKLVVFRTDSSVQIGTGHMSRCLALAATLRSSGAETIFVSRHILPNCQVQVASGGHALLRLMSVGKMDEGAKASVYASWLGTGWRQDAEETAAALNSLACPPDWLVVDHYALGAEWEGSLRGSVGRILAIDDLADRDHDCDILLDQNLHEFAERRYRQRVPQRANLLLGPRYALLRSEFAAARRAGTVRDAAPKRILVFMGGVDALNYTRVAIEAFLTLGRKDLTLEVVVGRDNPQAQSLAETFGGYAGIQVSADVPDMARRLRNADIAIGAGGVAMWERCCLGLATITVAVSDNQEPGAQEMAEWGATLYLGRAAEADKATLHGALTVLLAAHYFRASLAAKAGDLVDGEGAIRVARALIGSELNLRPATAADRDRILAWRNHEDTRRYSSEAGEISELDHARWFAGILNDPSRKLLVAEENGVPVGVLRFDLRTAEATVSIYLVPGQAGRGIGLGLLSIGESWLARCRPDIKTLVAQVHNDNGSSLHLFRRAGFERSSVMFRKEVGGHG